LRVEFLTGRGSGPNLVQQRPGDRARSQIPARGVEQRGLQRRHEVGVLVAGLADRRLERADGVGEPSAQGERRGKCQRDRGPFRLVLR
jgi:hypothetical protein